MLQRRGMAIKLQKSHLTKEKIVEAIQEIIGNQKYAENAKLLSKMIAAKPTKAFERVVKYAEFAAQFGDTGTLQVEGRHQSFAVLYSLDVIAFLLGVAGFLLGFLYWGTKNGVSILKRKFLSNEKKKNN